MSSIEFNKYQGIGNDFIIFDALKDSCNYNNFYQNKTLIKYLCDRNYGIGADGVLLLLPKESSGIARMEIFNSDGSIAEMCGNGIRCLIRYIIDKTKLSSKKYFSIETKAGIISSFLTNDDQIKVDMGPPIFDPILIPTTIIEQTFGIPTKKIEVQNKILQVYAVGMGNPHMVIFVESLEEFPFQLLGKALETNEYFPKNTNVHFVEIVNHKNLLVKVWERSAGPTLACGTGACACLATAFTLDLCDCQSDVILPGGTLNIHWPEVSGPIYMTGPAEHVFTGTVNI